jgi:hypothetical protein
LQYDKPFSASSATSAKLPETSRGQSGLTPPAVRVLAHLDFYHYGFCRLEALDRIRRAVA